MALLLQALRNVRSLSGEFDLLPPRVEDTPISQLRRSLCELDDVSARFELAEGCALPVWHSGHQDRRHAPPTNFV